MFKSDYAAFRYIAISVLLKTAPVKYGKSYLYTETDGMDLTYFVDYQCQIILRAIGSFKEVYLKSSNDLEVFNTWLWDSGLYRKLNEKQRAIFQIAKNDKSNYFTATSVMNGLGCSYNTAATVLNDLVKLGLFRKYKEGREWRYIIHSIEHIDDQLAF